MNKLIAAAVTLALTAPVSALEFAAELREAHRLAGEARARRMSPQSRLSNHRACPRDGGAWVEETGAMPQSIWDAHLMSGLDRASPSLIPVDGVSWWIGASRRGRGDCFLNGTAALYANGLEDAPATDFVKVATDGQEATLRASLIELRWFKDGKRHRWFNRTLASRLGWSKDGRIPLPDAINELL